MREGGTELSGAPRVTRGNTPARGQDDRPPNLMMMMMMTQETVGGRVLAEGGSRRRCRVGDGLGGVMGSAGQTLAGGASQTETNDGCQLSRCVCSAVENPNHKSGARGRTSLSQRV